jgi:hypothetical protein
MFSIETIISVWAVLQSRRLDAGVSSQLISCDIPGERGGFGAGISLEFLRPFTANHFTSVKSSVYA